MPDRFFRAGIAAASLCCLMLASACSDSNDRDDDDQADAGQQQTDAGQQQQTDAGNEECPLTTDCAIAACDGRTCGANNAGQCSGGQCVVPSQIGDSCSGGTQANPAGTCSAGQVCSDFEFIFFSRQELEGKATCTKTCATDNDCGQTNGVSNSCVTIDANNSFCVKGCTPGGSDCQDDTVCLTFGQPPNGTNVCVAQCEVNDDCVFGMTCLAAGTGIKACNPQACPQGGCGEGRACQPFGQQNLCVDACSDENPCPSGLECETATGICKPHSGTYYQTCNQTTACPETDAFCAAPGGGDGACLQVCTETGVCGEGDPAGTDCAITLSFQGENAPPPISLCALPCTAGTTTCPAGTTCQAPGGSGSTYCLP